MKKINLEYLFSKCINIIKQNEGNLLTKQFNSLKTRLRIKCINGHIFSKNYKSILQKKWCKKCKFNKNENICRYIIETLFKCEFKKCRPKWLKNPNTNRTLELDGYNEKLKIAFEYDGEFHYKTSNKNNKKKLLNQKNRDKIKDELCKKNDIILIRIPYYIKKENYQSHIIKKCLENNINIYYNETICINNIKLYSNKLNEIKEQYSKLNIELITDSYTNGKEKLQWICSNSHNFECNLINMNKRKNKCLICKKNKICY